MLNKISKFFVIVFFLSIICLIFNGYVRKNEIDTIGKASVGKFVSHESWGKGECNYFLFYIDGKEYRGNGGRAPEGFKENIGKFYRIKYSEKYKGDIQALFFDEVTDTNEILQAGFKIEK